MRYVILAQKRAAYTSRRLLEAARARGHVAVPVDPSACTLVLGDGRTEVHTARGPIGPVDVAIPRFISSGIEPGVAVLDQLVLQGAAAANRGAAIRRVGNKIETLQRLAEAGVAVPRSVMSLDRSHIGAAIDAVGGLPVALRLVHGNERISGVVVCRTAESAESMLDALWSLGQHILLQECSRAGGRDTRVLVVGGVARAAVARRARSASSGRERAPTPVTPRLRVPAEAAAGALDLDVAAVDLIETASGIAVADASATPSLEPFQKATGLDLAGCIVEWAGSLASAGRTPGRRARTSLSAVARTQG